MTNEEYDLAVAINRTDFEHQWADAIDIHALMRVFPDWGLVIVDDTYTSIVLEHNGPVERVRHWRVLQRNYDHYRIIDTPHARKLVTLSGRRLSDARTQEGIVWQVLIVISVSVAMCAILSS